MSSVSRLFRSLATPMGRLSRSNGVHFHQPIRTAVTSDTGAFLPDPERAKMGISGITVTVSIGLMLGAMISKNMASFLEENELFVPSDDDDDD
ncbi:Protein EMRE, mitochondrial [Orchesella cincta]|uniref:Essential MCU regulator, mitochondrial n=1 Tax=Orchesella cincta TaxID=48709 RepID=A0A1D2MJW3_ORCCI|nr:Protein EMRE, mitochondrial [Orchesella cincta]